MLRLTYHFSSAQRGMRLLRYAERTGRQTHDRYESRMMAVRERRRFGCAGLGLSQMRIRQTHAKGCVSFTASWVARIFPAVVA